MFSSVLVDENSQTKGTHRKQAALCITFCTSACASELNALAAPGTQSKAVFLLHLPHNNEQTNG